MSVYNMLYDWQKKIVDSIKPKYSYGLFLDMGCGKTPISLALAEQHECTKIIIVSINAKVLETEEIDGSFPWWIKKFDKPFNIYNKKDAFDYVDNPKANYVSDNTNDVYMINYESLYKRNSLENKGKKKKDKKVELNDNLSDFISSCRGCRVCLIIDESHKMKDYDSLQTKALRLLQQKIKNFTPYLYTYLLTGTPFTQGYIDLYSQLKFLGCSINKTQFKDNYCIMGRVPSLQVWQQPIIGYRNIPLLLELVHKYAITLKSKDVQDLPEQIFYYHNLNLNDNFTYFTLEKMKADAINKLLKHRGIDERVREELGEKKVNNPFYRNIMYPDDKWTADTAGQFWLRSRELSIGFQGNMEEAIWFDKTRLEALERLLEQNPDNYVLFYNYTPEFLAIYDICEKLGYKIDIYNGEFKSEDNYIKYCSLSDSDKLTDSKRIILANFASGGTGKNWQEYNKCILFSIPTFGNYQQALKRVHRTGQKHTVVYHVFKQNNWLDNDMWKSLESGAEYDTSLFNKKLNTVNLDNFLDIY